MAYLIFTANGEEYDRRELRGPLVVGRAPDCDVSIHDIILSRHHCRIEPRDEGGEQQWLITDLHSKNGTFLRGKQVERHALTEGDELRVGRTRLTFKAGAFVPAAKVRKPAVTRAADPSEALAGTVTGMVVCEPGEVQSHPGLPTPKPRPADPSAYARDDVYGMINEIISSSWDSVMAQNSEPIRRERVMPSAAVTKAVRGSVQPKPRVSFALQAGAESEHAAPLLPAVAALAPARHRSSGDLRLCTNGFMRPLVDRGRLLFFAVWMTMTMRARDSPARSVAESLRRIRLNPT